MSKGILVVALILVVIAGAFAWFVGKSLESDSRPISAPSSSSDSREMIGALRAIDSRLEAIEVRLGQLEGRDASRTQVDPLRSQETEKPTNLLDPRRPPEANRVSNFWPVLQGRDLHAPPRWDELQKFYEEYSKDRAEALKSVLYQPASKIWERFGVPNDFPVLDGAVSSAMGKIAYDRDSQTGVTRAEFHCECGIVVGGYAEGN